MSFQVTHGRNPGVFVGDNSSQVTMACLNPLFKIPSFQEGNLWRHKPLERPFSVSRFAKVEKKMFAFHEKIWSLGQSIQHRSMALWVNFKEKQQPLPSHLTRKIMLWEVQNLSISKIPHLTLWMVPHVLQVGPIDQRHWQGAVEGVEACARQSPCHDYHHSSRISEDGPQGSEPPGAPMSMPSCFWNVTITSISVAMCACPQMLFAGDFTLGWSGFE